MKKGGKLPKLYLTLKPEGRIRPIGAYSAWDLKNLFSLASRALHSLLNNAGLKHFMLANSTDLKVLVASFNHQARERNFIITQQGYDIKSFYNWIHQTTLIDKIKFTFDLYRKKHHTDHISIPKLKTTKLPPIFGPTNLPEYITIHLDILFEILFFAINNASFTLGVHILKLIFGLPMG